MLQSWWREKRIKIVHKEGRTRISFARIRSAERSVDITKFWQMQNGHMSHKWVVILSKQACLVARKRHNLSPLSIVSTVSTCIYSLSKQGALDYIHEDVWMLAHVTSRDGVRYFLLVVDDCCMYIHIISFIWWITNSNNIMTSFVELYESLIICQNIMQDDGQNQWDVLIVISKVHLIQIQLE